METDERAALEARWFGTVAMFVNFLVRQHHHADARIAANATRLALGELLAWTETGEARVEAGTLTAEEATLVVGRIESLISNLGRRRALERVVAARRRVAAAVDVRSHAGFEARRYDVERALQAGDLSRGRELAEALHRDTESMGDDAYPGAAYDRAMAPNLVAQMLYAAGAADQALPLLDAARDRFLSVAKDSKDAARMAAVCLSRQGNCLLDLGQLEAAASAYEAALTDYETTGQTRSVAVDKLQLGTVRVHQGRTADAVELFRESRAVFEALGEPGHAAACWHQEGIAFRLGSRSHEAERCYLAALELKSRIGDEAGEASTLHELGNLYVAQRRLEEAAAHFGRAAETSSAAGQALNEARSLGNRAGALRQLGRLDEARADLSHALKLMAPFGLVAEPWKAHHACLEIETAAGDAQAAAEARSEAIRLYAVYRDGGGAPQQGTGRIVEDLCRRIADGADPAGLADQFPTAGAFSEVLHPFRVTLEALLRGHPADPDDPRLNYDEVVELRRLQAALRERRGE